MSAELTFDRAGRVQSGEGAVRCRAFYLAYPGIVATASHQSRSAPVASIWETPSPESHTPGDTLPSEAKLQGMLGEVLL